MKQKKSKKKIVYIVGKITGDSEYRAKFSDEAMRWDNNYTVLNPAILPIGLSYKTYIRIGSAMLDACDIVVLLPDWQDSKGATCEYHRAVALGKEIIDLSLLKTLSCKIKDVISFGEHNWQILDIQNDKALIISTNIIDRKAYHTITEHITWQHSTIRKWLNDEFYSAFSTEEQERILETKVINNDNPNYNTPGGNNTVDKIFLLSIDEYKAYKNIISNAAYWWWLRSPGYHGGRAAGVGSDGRVYVHGNDVDRDDSGVRPALWIKI